MKNDIIIPLKGVEMMGLILLTRYASALCLMLASTHLVALRPTLVEQSSQARSASIIGAGNNPQVLMTVAVAIISTKIEFDTS